MLPAVFDRHREPGAGVPAVFDRSETSSGFYNLSGGTLSSQSDAFIGYSGSGTFTQ
ncbi:MAG: hypothetical protein JO117_08310, partial [Verrucomicrobia bacterium]|nr:hypothetical protein [Verrucomicrobiota bacterium]